MNPLKPLALALPLLTALVAAPAQAEPPGFLHYSDCAEQTVLAAYPAVLFAGLLPAGFAFAPDEAGGQLALVHVSGSTCTDGGDGSPVSDVLAFVEVVPPPELQVPGLAAYGIFLRGWLQRPETVARFTAWGFGDLIGQARPSVTVQTPPGLRTGRTDAADARGGVSTRTTTLGPTVSFGAARARLFRVQNGVATHAIEGSYSAQSARLGTGSLTQSGQNFLPLAVGVGAASHAWGYDLSVEPVALYP